MRGTATSGSMPGRSSSARNELPERTGDEEFQLIPLLPPEHIPPPLTQIIDENGINRRRLSTTPLFISTGTSSATCRRPGFAK